MAYIQLPTTDIIITIPSVTIGGTVIDRKAHLFDLQYNQQQKRVSLQWVVKHYAAGTDEYLSFIPDYTRATTADNNTMCDAATGIPIDPADLEAYTSDYTGQYDFFAYVAENHDIRVNGTVRQFGALIQNWEKQ